MKKKESIWAARAEDPARARDELRRHRSEKLEMEGVTARVVGWAMSESPEGVPWWRVVNSKGECSVDRGSRVKRQQRKLEAEGVKFSPAGRLSMTKYQWG